MKQTDFNCYVAGVRELDSSLELLFQTYVDEDEAYVGSRLEVELIGAAEQLQIEKIEVLMERSPTEWTESDCVLMAEYWENAVNEGDINEMQRFFNACVNDTRKDINENFQDLEEKISIIEEWHKYVS